MSTLIIYASKYGCTADCAAYLKTKISGNTKLIDVNKADGKISLNEYDTIIIGGSVYIGKVSKKLRVFCENNLDLLTKKRVGIFLCCALSEQINEVLKSNFPAVLLNKAADIKIFGSEARLEKMSFLDKAMIKVVTKGDYSKFKISYENIEDFAKKLS